MICQKLRQGQNNDCATRNNKYYQQVVLVNREDLLNKRIFLSTVSIEDDYLCRHRVLFNLMEGSTGFRFSINENASSIFGNSEKTVQEGIPQYMHNVTIIVSGVDEATKCLLRQLDYADYFAALQFYDGTVEIFGFEYGLSTNSYTYDAMNGGGGSVIQLKSLSDSLENYHPFVYKSSIDGNEIVDFDNNFENIPFFENGDFNNDFNNDFDNE